MSNTLSGLHAYVCMYVRMYVCTYVCMYVHTYVRMYVCNSFVCGQEYHSTIATFFVLPFGSWCPFRLILFAIVLDIMTVRACCSVVVRLLQGNQCDRGLLWPFSLSLDDFADDLRNSQKCFARTINDLIQRELLCMHREA